MAQTSILLKKKKKKVFQVNYLENLESGKLQRHSLYWLHLKETFTTLFWNQSLLFSEFSSLFLVFAVLSLGLDFLPKNHVKLGI